MIDSALDLAAGQLSSGLDAETMAASQGVAQQLAASEWLGPLAPIALSPFFGLAMLSGVATYGPEWLQERSALFSESSAFNSPALFWTMFALALITSLPRLSKVSKPLALAADNLEAYSAVIILIVVRFLGSGSGEMIEPATAAIVPQTLSAGLASMPADFLMSGVAALNVIVINFVKLFFEFLIWIIPFPTVDAALEAGNKLVSAGLMALYCFSPILATVVNLLLLAICLIAFGWVYRRLVFYREVIAGPILAWLIPGWYRQRGNTIRAFCQDPEGGLPSQTLVRITQLSDSSFQIRGRWLWRTLHLELDNCSADSESGLAWERLTLIDTDGKSHIFSHRKWVDGDNYYRARPESEPSQTVLQG